ncbi:hypothetical protein [Pseudogulbenkiania subflava]|uniref:Uncharacterized protein n=1 Tax=Pseudogulbenkiania subflava DSM 22618 TaxID=1123014 RepID=A0A1Y6BPS2_9NEIS|nr:hypothetical protein [Pseudogulbenkiania subflava]SMF22793.1 hypothetical protein SAMN02745746_01998 [Pseudogulbenkiania subflava DSM 22618]
MNRKHRLAGWLLLLALALALPLGGCRMMDDHMGGTPTHDSDMGSHGRSGGGY